MPVKKRLEQLVEIHGGFAQAIGIHQQPHHHEDV
jgi:hypothetical protein